MKVFIILNFLATLFLTASCNSKDVPVEIAGACAAENDGKLIEVMGHVTPSLSVFCSGTSGRTECVFLLKETSAGEKEIRVNIEQGTSANAVEKPESSYTKDNIRMRDDNGNLMNLAEKARLTGIMRVSAEAGVCNMKVTKIE